MMGQVGVGLFFMNVNVYYWKKVSLQIKAHSYNSQRQPHVVGMSLNWHFFSLDFIPFNENAPFDVSVCYPLGQGVQSELVQRNSQLINDRFI